MRWERLPLVPEMRGWRWPLRGQRAALSAVIGRFGEGWAGTAQPSPSNPTVPSRQTKKPPAGEAFLFDSGGDGVRQSDVRKTSLDASTPLNLCVIFAN